VPEAEPVEAAGEPAARPLVPGLARVVKELSDGRYLLLYTRPDQSPAGSG